MTSDSVHKVFVFSKKGDGGTTSLLSGERVSKANLRPEAYGTLDEASSMMGIVKALTRHDTVKRMVDTIQADLVMLGAELASTHRDPPYKISKEAIERLEEWIQELQLEVPLPREFVYPGATFIGAVTDVSRTIVRRAERRMAALRDEGEHVRSEALSYINRLADFLFTLARYLDATEKGD
ncbi:MAG: cob(I)yrinic acid a,c-diamide adenosyltransferase [Syntrophobacterales bacterium]|nr:cob(I)yrinic acid a,c-diamide adenosyltransferase [Syntrophobacterales bacterium]